MKPARLVIDPAALVPDEPSFVTRQPLGVARVHVAVPAVAREAWWDRMRALKPVYRTLYPAQDPMTALMGIVGLMCGQVAANPWTGSRWTFVDTFADAQLCGTCRSAWSGAGLAGPLLFKHPQPGGVCCPGDCSHGPGGDPDLPSGFAEEV